ncbi:hypothetical protein LTR13_010600 [Exophiala sideris]|nr:hypothetical protein LTR13_010600 [Exophiala sideris]
MSNAVAVAAPKLSPIADNIINTLDSNFLEELAKLPLPAGNSQDPTDHVTAREWMDKVYRPLPKTPRPIRHVRGPTSVKIHDVTVTYGPEEEFNIRVYEPQVLGHEESGLLPAVLAYHGGGWIHGYSELDDDSYKFMARETQSVIFGVDYRLAPEHPFPAPHNDSYEALNYVVKNAQQYGIDTTRIAVWGASAGGNLVAGIALRDAQEHSQTRIRHANLVVPAVCPPTLAPPILSVPSSSYTHFTTHSNPLMLTGAERLWEIYANGQDNLRNPYVSPLLAAPSSNHCPMHVVVAGADVLRDEGIAYALKYRNAGCDVQLETVPGAPHGLTASTEAWVSRQFWTNQVRVLNVALHTGF